MSSIVLMVLALMLSYASRRAALVGASPTSIFFGFWAAAFFFHSLGNPNGVGLISVAIWAMAFMVVAFCSRVIYDHRQGITDFDTRGLGDSTLLRVVAWLLVVVIVLASNYYRLSVQNAGGLRELRAGIAGGDIDLPPWVSLAVLISPLALVLLIEYERLVASRIVGIGLIVATLASLDSRTAALYPIMVAAVYGLIRTLERPKMVRMGRYVRLPRTRLFLLLVVLSAASFFVMIGRNVQKFDSEAAPTDAFVEAIESGSVYLVGGISLTDHLVEGEYSTQSANWGRSIWLPIRALHLVGVSDHSVETVLPFSEGAEPFNTLAWVGDLYADFGLFGVAMGSILLGALLGYVDLVFLRSRTRSRPGSALTASVILVGAMVSFSGYRFLVLQPVVTVVLGLLLFRAASRNDASSVGRRMHSHGSMQYARRPL